MTGDKSAPVKKTGKPPKLANVVGPTAGAAGAGTDATGELRLAGPEIRQNVPQRCIIPTQSCRPLHEL